jgi:hypothetical protein
MLEILGTHLTQEPVPTHLLLVQAPVEQEPQEMVLLHSVSVPEPHSQSISEQLFGMQSVAGSTHWLLVQVPVEQEPQEIVLLHPVSTPEPHSQPISVQVFWVQPVPDELVPLSKTCDPINPFVASTPEPSTKAQHIKAAKESKRKAAKMLFLNEAFILAPLWS